MLIAFWIIVLFISAISKHSRRVFIISRRSGAVESFLKMYHKFVMECAAMIPWIFLLKHHITYLYSMVLHFAAYQVQIYFLFIFFNFSHEAWRRFSASSSYNGISWNLWPWKKLCCISSGVSIWIAFPSKYPWIMIVFWVCVFVVTIGSAIATATPESATASWPKSLFCLYTTEVLSLFCISLIEGTLFW